MRYLARNRAEALGLGHTHARREPRLPKIGILGEAKKACVAHEEKRGKNDMFPSSRGDQLAIVA